MQPYDAIVVLLCRGGLNRRFRRFLSRHPGESGDLAQMIGKGFPLSRNDIRRNGEVSEKPLCGHGMIRRRRRSWKRPRNIASVSTNSWKPKRRDFELSPNMS